MLKWACVLAGLFFFPAFCATASVNDLFISEVLPNPIGDEAQNEFIKIYNSGAEEIDLAGLFLDDAEGGSTPFVIPAGAKISAAGYLTFYAKETGISLTNTGERARILNSDKTVLTEVIYGNAVENYSYVRKADGAYAWTTPPNPENVFVVPEATPTPSPAVTPTPTPSASPSNSPTPMPDYSGAKGLVLNEVLPDPSGNDGENEFIEIYNSGSVAVDLSGFYVDDADGGSTPHKIDDGTIFEAGGYLVFYSRDTKIALNNGGDSARLLYPDKTILSSITFESSPHEDRSYARKSDSSFAWTSEPTPGEENEFVTPTEEPSPSAKPTATPKVVATPKPTRVPKATAIPKGRITATDNNTTQNFTVRKPRGTVLGISQTGKKVALADLSKEKIGTLVSVHGIVSQAPGTFDPRLMYLVGSGVAVFLTSGDYPVLALGDMVAVTGVLVKPSRELFIAVGAKELIVKESAGTPPEPHVIELKDLDDDKIGWLIKTEGLVTAKNNFLELKDGEKTIKVLLQENMEANKTGERVSVTGIVSVDGEGLRILATKIETLKVEQPKINSSILSTTLKRWRVGVSASCFGIAIVLAIMVYAPKRIIPKVNFRGDP